MYVYICNTLRLTMNYSNYPSLINELVYQTRVLRCDMDIQGRLYWNSLIIYHHCANYGLILDQSLKGFF